MEKIPKVPALASPLEIKQEYSVESHDKYRYKIAGRDDVVVRSLNWKEHLSDRKFHPLWEKDSISAAEFAQVSKMHFDELASYGVAVPASFLVADIDRNGRLEEEVFAVVDDIAANPKPNQADLAAAYITLNKQLLRYFTDKFESQQSFLADLIMGSQYVYGRKAGDTADHLYLVDVQPYIFRGDRMLATTVDAMVHAVDHEWGVFKLSEFEALSSSFSALLRRIKASAV